MNMVVWVFAALWWQKEIVQMRLVSKAYPTDACHLPRVRKRKYPPEDMSLDELRQNITKAKARYDMMIMLHVVFSCHSGTMV